VSSPIADLSYRGYEGELESPTYRWWVIARMSIRLAFKKKWYWIFTIGAGIYYALIMIIIYFMEQFSMTGAQAERGLREFISRIIWKDQFLHALSFGQLWFLFLALLLGAGAIANDNRSNALLVYLSKPSNKTDYFMGKWMGIFIPLCIAMAIPAGIFWLYGALSYRPYGFLANDPWVVVKVALAIPILSALYTSLVLFFSSLFKHGRVAGAAFAGLYFLTNIFTQLMVVAWMASQGFGRRSDSVDELRSVVPVIEKLFYASVDGLSIGATKAILGTDGSAYFGFPTPIKTVPAPSLIGVLLTIVVISSLANWVAWRRIHAVEVVG
jgi:ABC-2 type transport system permease protein